MIIDLVVNINNEKRKIIYIYFIYIIKYKIYITVYLVKIKLYDKEESLYKSIIFWSTNFMSVHNTKHK